MVCARLLFFACLGCFASGCGGAQHSGDETSSMDDAPRNTSHRKKVAHKHRDEDEDAPKTRKTPSHDDSDDEDGAKHAEKTTKPHRLSADDDEDRDAVPKKKAAKKTGDDDDDDAPKKAARKPARNKPTAAKKTADADDAPKKPKNPHSEAADDDEDAPKKPARKAAAKKPADDDDEDAPKKPARKAAAKKPADDDDEDAPKKPVRKAATKKPADDDDEDAPKKAAAKVAVKKPADEDDAPKKPARKKVTPKPADDVDDESAPKKAAAKVVVKKPADEDDAPKKPARKKVTPKPADDEDDEATPKKAAAKVAVEKPADEDEEAPTKPARKTTTKKSADDEDAEVKPRKQAERSTEDDDAPAAKPKAVAVKAKAKSKSNEAKVDDDKPREPKPEEPPKKQRSIEEDIAVDDPLATNPPPRAVASADEADAAGDGATTDAVAVAAAPLGTQLQDRTLTTPEGQIELHAGLPISVLTVTDATGMSTSSTSEGLALGVAYGVNAKAEVGLDYTLGLSPGKLEGPATLHGAYSLAHGKLDFAAAAAIAIDFYDTVDPTTMATSSQTAASLQLGAWARYHATPTLSIFTGLPGTPNTSASLSRLAFALPVLSYQVQIGLSGGGTTAITLPIGLGYQASPKLYTFASVNLANIRIANTSNAFLFKDYIPIAIGGFYSFDTFSVGASFADDLEQGFGYLRFELTARYLLH
jgi:hypothetical protein